MTYALREARHTALGSLPAQTAPHASRNAPRARDAPDSRSTIRSTAWTRPSVTECHWMPDSTRAKSSNDQATQPSYRSVQSTCARADQDVRSACRIGGVVSPATVMGSGLRQAESRSYGLHGQDGVPDSDLVTFLQPLGCLDAAPVQPGAVGRAQVFDIPPAAGNLEACVAAGGEFVVDDEAAFPAHGELGIEGAAAVGGLDAQGPGRRSEEHTSELQSRGHLVCRLLLEKK